MMGYNKSPTSWSVFTAVLKALLLVIMAARKDSGAQHMLVFVSAEDAIPLSSTHVKKKCTNKESGIAVKSKIECTFVDSNVNCFDQAATKSIMAGLPCKDMDVEIKYKMYNMNDFDMQLIVRKPDNSNGRKTTKLMLDDNDVTEIVSPGTAISHKMIILPGRSHVAKLRSTVNTCTPVHTVGMTFKMKPVDKTYGSANTCSTEGLIVFNAVPENENDAHSTPTGPNISLDKSKSEPASSPHKSPSSTKKGKGSGSKKGEHIAYEVWASDQSNSVPGQSTPGTKGGFLWIWDSASIKNQIENSMDALPLSCTPNASHGPCNLLEIFPLSLSRCTPVRCTGETLEDLVGFGRLHGVIKDPFNRYVVANIFAPGGGYVGVIDAETKEGIGLFRVTGTSMAIPRSVHMSFWSADGSAIIIANLNGKMIERIDVRRAEDGSITDLEFRIDAGIYLGKAFTVTDDASYFEGINAFGRPLIGSIDGSYSEADTGDFTPNMVCKESGCNGPQPLGGDRPNNVPICPIPSSNNYVYATLGGGGLFVIKLDTTPMKIIAEYGSAVINGAGCAGVEAKGRVFLDGGVSASGSGATQSTFTLYAFEEALFSANLNSAPIQNYPMPIQVFKDSTNTNTIGNVDGIIDSNLSGQMPNKSTRRDSHGGWATIDSKYVHIADRIQNVIEVFDAETFEHVNTYDLVSIDGKSGREGPSGPCRSKSVLDDGNFVLNDPAPDLFEITPDGKYFAIAFRGPVPVSVPHSAQGSCPGVGIVEITEGGRAGYLIDVLRATNTVDDVPAGTISGGHNYAGAERSDVHGAIVVFKN